MRCFRLASSPNPESISDCHPAIPTLMPFPTRMLGGLASQLRRPICQARRPKVFPVAPTHLGVVWDVAYTHTMTTFIRWPSSLARSIALRAWHPRWSHFFVTPGSAPRRRWRRTVARCEAPTDPQRQRPISASTCLPQAVAEKYEQVLSSTIARGHAKGNKGIDTDTAQAPKVQWRARHYATDCRAACSGSGVVRRNG